MRYAIGVLMVVFGNGLVAQYDEETMGVRRLTEQMIPKFIEACPDYLDESDVRDILISGYIHLNAQEIIESRTEYLMNMLKLSMVTEIQAEKKGVKVPDCMPTWGVYARTRLDGIGSDFAIIVAVTSVLNAE